MKEDCISSSQLETGYSKVESEDSSCCITEVQDLGTGSQAPKEPIQDAFSQPLWNTFIYHVLGLALVHQTVFTVSFKSIPYWQNALRRLKYCRFFYCTDLTVLLEVLWSVWLALLSASKQKRDLLPSSWEVCFFFGCLFFNRQKIQFWMKQLSHKV